MASLPKRKRLTKSQRKKVNSDKGKKGSKERGLGLGGRLEFELPAKWETEIVSAASKESVLYVSPGKTKYRTQSSVKETLSERGMDLCFNHSSEESSSESQESQVKYGPIPKKQPKREGQQIEQRLFVCDSLQIVKLIDDINKNSKCSTEDCDGMLVATKVEQTGLGGTMNVTFNCNKCQFRTVSFQGSLTVEESKRTVVGLALSVAFVITGHGFSKFNKTLNQCLGISAISKNRFYEVIKLIYPHITAILNEMCDEEKERLKNIEKHILGSWERAVVTSDGVWQTRGHFSKNGSFIIKNYDSGGILWYGHKCMKGDDNVVEEELFEGTAKSVEGILADECYGLAKEEGCNIEVVWQDGDSSSSKSVTKHHGDGKIYKCGGHVGRAHTNNLKDFSKMKQFSETMVSRNIAKFPEIANAKCKCKRHSQSCGCLSEAFIKGARINHFCCLQQCNTSIEYARRMRALGENHCQNIHKWEGGECGFHELVACSCGKCVEDEELVCEGKPYTTKNVLKCEFHRLAYRIECERRAEDAESVIHPEMGRGHSNQCEAHFSVLPKFRSKDQNLCRLHYMTSTNCGLCQGNMSWCFKQRGKDYHWITDLYQRLKLPVVPAVVQALRKDVEERNYFIEDQKTDEYRHRRVQRKVARAEDQSERKKWVKRQTLRHTYGRDDDYDEEEDPSLVNEAQTLMEGIRCENGEMVVISGKKCKCGSVQHRRTSHRLCPLNEKKK